MKKLIKITAIVFLCHFHGMAYSQESVSPDDGNEFPCYAEKIICNWVTGASRTICHKLGDSYKCDCGYSTQCNGNG